MISAACCVFDCPGGVPADQVDSGGRLTLFHPFPIGDPARLAEWCNLLMLEADSSFGEMYVCSSHFSPQQYDFSSGELWMIESIELIVTKMDYFQIAKSH